MHHIVAMFFLFFYFFISFYFGKEEIQLSPKREASVYLGREVPFILEKRGFSLPRKRGSIYLGKERFRFNSERRFRQIILMTELENRAYAVPPGRRCLFPHTIGVFHLLIPLPLLRIRMVRPRVQRMIGN